MPPGFASGSYGNRAVLPVFTSDGNRVSGQRTAAVLGKRQLHRGGAVTNTAVMPVPLESLTDVEVGAPPCRILCPAGGHGAVRGRPSSANATASSCALNALFLILSSRLGIATPSCFGGTTMSVATTRICGPRRIGDAPAVRVRLREAQMDDIAVSP